MVATRAGAAVASRQEQEQVHPPHTRIQRQTHSLRSGDNRSGSHLPRVAEAPLHGTTVCSLARPVSGRRGLGLSLESGTQDLAARPMIMVPQVIIGLVLIFLESWKLSLMMLAVVPAITIVAIVYGRFMKRFSKQRAALVSAGAEKDHPPVPRPKEDTIGLFFEVNGNTLLRHMPREYPRPRVNHRHRPIPTGNPTEAKANTLGLCLGSREPSSKPGPE